MKRIFGLVLAVGLAAAAAPAADTLTESFQKALFEEEANQNLDAAIQGYQAVLEATDAQRKLVATALFRLGECYRKLGRTNEAVAQYQRLLRDFSDQTNLVTLSRQNLRGLGATPAAPETGAGPHATAVAAADTDDEEKQIRRIKTLVQHSPDLINARGLSGEPPPLIQAAERGHLAVAKYLLSVGASVDVQGAFQATALHHAVRGGHKAMVELLLAHGANVNAQDKDGESPLFNAASKGFRAVAETLLDHKADPNLRSAQGRTPLFSAAQGDWAEVAELLLNRGADVTVQDRTGWTALDLAAFSGAERVTRLLVSRRDLLQAKPDAHETALSWAIGNRQIKTAQVLLSAGANPKVKVAGEPLLHVAVVRQPDTAGLKLLLAHKVDLEATDTGGRTALARAVESRRIDAARLLLEAGANPNVKLGGTPLLHLAVDSDTPELLRLLLAAKPDVEAVDANTGYTPLHRAVANRRQEAVRLLLEAGANPDRPFNAVGQHRFVLRAAGGGEPASVRMPVAATDTTGATPLAVASRLGDLTVVEALLAHRANVHVSDAAGLTPLHYAVLHCSLPMLEVVLAAKPDLEARAKTGQTALAVAVEMGEAKLVKRLIQAGANVNASLPEAVTTSLLHLAVEKDRLDVVELLCQHGADPNRVNGLWDTALDLARRRLQSVPADQRRPVEAIIACLLRHGADERVSRRLHLQVSRQADGFQARIFRRGTNDWNRYTLLELLAAVYAKRWQEPGSRLGFPDLSRVSIRRLGTNGAPDRVLTVDVAALLKGGACTNDLWLEWGDVVDIPEEDHPINARWDGLEQPLREALAQCLERQVQVRIRGESHQVGLRPCLWDPETPVPVEVPGARTETGQPVGSPRAGRMAAATVGTGLRLATATLPTGTVGIRSFRLRDLLKDSRLLWTSSDLSRVRVRRTDPLTGQPAEWVVDLSPAQGYDPDTDLWLRHGDVIEVPDK